MRVKYCNCGQFAKRQLGVIFQMPILYFKMDFFVFNIFKSRPLWQIFSLLYYKGFKSKLFYFMYIHNFFLFSYFSSKPPIFGGSTRTFFRFIVARNSDFWSLIFFIPENFGLKIKMANMANSRSSFFSSLIVHFSPRI